MVFLQWLMSKCYCKNWICCCLLRSLISPKRIKLESCGCAQKKRLEILFPDLIKFLSFQWGGVEKIWDQKCAFFLKQFDVSFTLTHWWKSRICSKTAKTRCTSSWHLRFTIFVTLSFHPEVLYSPLVGRYMCPTVVTDISFGYKSFNEGLNGYLGLKNLKKRCYFVKKWWPSTVIQRFNIFYRPE